MFLFKFLEDLFQDPNTISFIILISLDKEFLKITGTFSLSRKENQSVPKLSCIRDLLEMPLFKTFAKEFKFVNLISSFKPTNFLLAYQAVVFVSIQPLVLIVLQDMFWIQTTIASGVDICVLHVLKQHLKLVHHVNLDFILIQENV